MKTHLVDPDELNEAIAAFGRAVTETAIPRPQRVEAEAKVRDFLLALRKRLAFTNGERS